jgi:hypothetical protein
MRGVLLRGAGAFEPFFSARPKPVSVERPDSLRWSVRRRRAEAAQPKNFRPN